MTEFHAIDAAEQGAAALTVAGMARMPARVLMGLVGSPDTGYTAAEIAERLGVSSAAVSGAVRYLQDNLMIQKLSRPGDRVARYDIAEDGWGAYLTDNCPRYEQVAHFIDEIANQNHGSPISVTRARRTAHFFRFLATRLPELAQEWNSTTEPSELDSAIDAARNPSGQAAH